jgi:trimeric autotransporter adhesin
MSCPWAGRALLGGGNRWVDLLVGGWNVSAIVNYYNGTPLRFSASSPHAQWNGGTNRPNVAPGSLLNPSYKQSEFDFFNASSPSNTFLDQSKFSDPSPLILGAAAAAFSEARNFAVFNEDLALQKVIRFREKFRFQLRAEFLNAFNRHRLGGVNTNVTSPIFGQVTTVSGNRQIQIGARLDF